MDGHNYYGDYQSEYGDNIENKSLVNKQVCAACEHKDVCYIYKDICEGRRYYQDYFGEDVRCFYFKKRIKTIR